MTFQVKTVQEYNFIFHIFYSGLNIFKFTRKTVMQHSQFQDITSNLRVHAPKVDQFYF